jgi:hypothetical protein
MVASIISRAEGVANDVFHANQCTTVTIQPSEGDGLYTGSRKGRVACLRNDAV